jgi:putative ABC transport system permease protein
VLGKPEEQFMQPLQLIVSQSAAIRYFGSVDVIGKQVKIQNQRDESAEVFTINGVFRDFPENTHFKADWLCSLNKNVSRNLWLYTYMVLSKDADKKTIEANIDSLFVQPGFAPIFNLQPITDIHLQSHKTRELEAGGNQNALYLLLFGAIVILSMALANFFNLNYVQLIKNQSDIVVKRLHGATNKNLLHDELIEKLLIIFMAAIISSLIFFGAREAMQLNYLNGFGGHQFLMVISGLMLLSMVVAVLPVFRIYRQLNPMALKKSSTASFRLFFVMQFILSIMVISTVLVMKKQIGFINLLHPGAKSSNVVVLPHVPGNMSLKYDLFREKLLKHPEIIDVTAAMEEPAGVVTDNFGFHLQGYDNPDQPTLNMLCVDSNFFTFFNLKAIAGTIEIGKTASQEWEKNTLDFNDALQQNNVAEISRLTPLVTGYREKYLLNREALKYLGIQNPDEVIGKNFSVEFPIPYLMPDGEIIGVVDDFHYTNLFNKEKPLMIVCRKLFSRNYLCRIDTNNTAKSLAIIKQEWDTMNPDYPFQYEFLNDSYRKVYHNEYAQVNILGLFALIAVLISVLGMFALVTFQMQKQTKEIGIRKVIGAKVGEIVAMHNREMAKWVIIAFIIAAPLSWIIMHKWLQHFAYQTPLSWWLFALAGFIALLIALITISFQSLLVATRNPVEALRYKLM